MDLLQPASANTFLDVRVEIHTVMRTALNGILAAAQVVATCFMAWKALSLWAGTPYPLMIVTTESMVPAFAPGDILLISNHHQNVDVGDLPVCWLPDRAFPMVHRVLRVSYEEQSNPDITYELCQSLYSCSALISNILQPAHLDKRRQ
jgi:hypothetical protein